MNFKQTIQTLKRVAKNDGHYYFNGQKAFTENSVFKVLVPTDSRAKGGFPVGKTNEAVARMPGEIEVEQKSDDQVIIKSGRLRAAFSCMSFVPTFSSLLETESKAPPPGFKETLALLRKFMVDHEKTKSLFSDNQNLWVVNFPADSILVAEAPGFGNGLLPIETIDFLLSREAPESWELTPTRAVAEWEDGTVLISQVETNGMAASAPQFLPKVKAAQFVPIEGLDALQRVAAAGNDCLDIFQDRVETMASGILFEEAAQINIAEPRRVHAKQASQFFAEAKEWDTSAARHIAFKLRDNVYGLLALRV